MLLWLENIVEGFALPVLIRINGKEQRITVSAQPIRLDLDGALESFELDRNFYMKLAAQ